MQSPLRLKSMSEATKPILKGKVGILPTDTIYGLVCSAFHPSSVEDIYRIKKRHRKKPLVILVRGTKDLPRLGITLTARIEKFLELVWPGPVSIVLPSTDKKLHYLHRGSDSLAVRMPALPELIRLIQKTGPIVATSINTSGSQEANTVKEALSVPGVEASVSFCYDAGPLNNPASFVVKLLR